MRVAVIDIGTNSTRLLIGDAVDKSENQSGINVLKTRLVTTRLGEGIGSKRCLRQPAINRTIEALLEFKKIIKEHKAETVIAAATSAVRDAENQRDFLDHVKLKTGLEVRVLSGPEEAEMSYSGVVGGLKPDMKNPVVVDIGGGSTEFIWQGFGGINLESLRIGAVRMTESNLGLDNIKKLMSDVTNRVRSVGSIGLIGVGGTITTLAAVDMELEEYDPARVHGYYITRERVINILNRFEGMTLKERKAVTGLQPQRADIIIAGVQIVLAVLDGLKAEGIVASESDIMYGLFYRAIAN